MVRVLIRAALASPLLVICPSAQAEPAGDTAWALPGVNRTSQVSDANAQAHVGIAATTGYGYTEAIGSDTGSHKRGQGSLAVSYTPYPWVSAALRLRGRIDLHPEDDWGKDRTFVAEPAMALRFGGNAAKLGLPGYELGAQLVVVAPGSEAPSIAFDAISFEATGMLQHRLTDSPITLATELGYRRDRTKQVVADPLTIRPGDRISLSASDFDAALIRVAGVACYGSLEPFAELSSDILLGVKAPSLTTSPIRLGLGARLALSDSFALSVTTETALSSRPDVNAYALMVPIDPRFTVFAGIQTRVSFGPKPVAVRTLIVEAPEVVVPEEPVSTGRRFTGRIIDASGRPIAEVMVRVEAGGKVYTVQTDQAGSYVLDGIPRQRVVLTIAGEGYSERRLEIPGEDIPKPELVLDLIANQGWLRGETTNFQGEPMQARVTVGERVFQTGEDGFFEFSLPVGDYEVVVEVEGYLSQRHHLKIEEGAVVIVNAELRPTKKRRQ